jgi:hypothetical protein
MQKIKITSKTTLQVTHAEGHKAIKYKGYEVGYLPSLFGFIYDSNEERDGISSWFNYKGLTYLRE